MNKENILAVADAIEQHTLPLGFNMQYYFGQEGELPDRSGHNCETTACIGGWAMALEAGSIETASDWGTTADPFKWLDLTNDQRMNLFYGFNHPYLATDIHTLSQITPDQAVRTLRHLAATGTVDWTV